MTVQSFGRNLFGILAVVLSLIAMSVYPRIDGVNERNLFMYLLIGVVVSTIISAFLHTGHRASNSEPSAPWLRKLLGYRNGCYYNRNQMAFDCLNKKQAIRGHLVSGYTRGLDRCGVPDALFVENAEKWIVFAKRLNYGDRYIDIGEYMCRLDGQEVVLQVIEVTENDEFLIMHSNGIWHRYYVDYIGSINRLD